MLGGSRGTKGSDRTDAHVEKLEFNVWCDFENAIQFLRETGSKDELPTPLTLPVTHTPPPPPPLPPMLLPRAGCTQRARQIEFPLCVVGPQQAKQAEGPLSDRDKVQANRREATCWAGGGGARCSDKQSDWVRIARQA